MDRYDHQLGGAVPTPLTFGSLFAGIGGFDLGFEKAGMKCKWQVEIESFPIRVLERHWPNVKRLKDVKNVGKQELESVDAICGGFPCQDLSVAGRRAGLAGERSGLWWEFHRIISELRSRWVVIENVPGLLSSNKGGDMGALLWSLGQLGYGWAYRVLDAQYFGVPQRRRRVFIVGCLGDATGAAKVLLEPESSAWSPAPSRKTGRVSATLSASGAGTSRTGGQAAEPDFLVSHTLKSRRHGSSHDPTHDTYVPGKSKKDDKQNGSVRRLTPLECERLQGFPDGWTAIEGDETPDTPRYKAIGNAVAVPVVEWIGRRIVAVEQERREA